MVPCRFVFWVFLFLLAFFGNPALLEEFYRYDSKVYAQPKDPISSELEGIEILDLQTAQRIALIGKPSLAAAEERIKQAKQRVAQAVSKYWPRLDGSVEASREWLSDTIRAQNQSLFEFARGLDPNLRTFFLDDPEDFYRAKIRATWVLFEGFARYFSVAAARFGESESEQALMDARRLILSSVALSYHKAQLARENIAIAETDVAFYQRQVEDAKARYRVGTGSLSDVLNLEVQVNSARSKVIQGEREYETSLIGLAAVMGVPDASLPPGKELARLETETRKELSLPEPAPLISYAREHRPDILQLNYLVEQARAQIRVAEAEFFPVVSLYGSAEGERTDNLSFKEEDFNYAVGVMLTYNFYSGGSSSAKFREASAKAAEADMTKRGRLINVASEVRQSISSLKQAQNELVLQRSNVVFVQQNRDLADKEYKAGEASLVRLNEAQRDLTSAQSRLALALVGLRQAWQDLDFTTGQILSSFSQ